MSVLQLIYTNATGAGIIRTMPHDEDAIEGAMRRLAALHLTARLTCDGETIGEVYKRDGRWNWIFDPAPVRAATAGGVEAKGAQNIPKSTD